jgi:two-component system cell cycle response regulator DivK
MSRAHVPTVLLVEDHQDSREMYADFLRLSGFVVIEAGSGAEGLTLGAVTLPWVVVTDLRMGASVSSAEICRAFARRGVPVIAVTGHAPGAFHDEIRAAGGAAVLLKPITPDRLLREIQGLIEAHEAG